MGIFEAVLEALFTVASDTYTDKKSTSFQKKLSAAFLLVGMLISIGFLVFASLTVAKKNPPAAVVIALIALSFIVFTVYEVVKVRRQSKK